MMKTKPIKRMNAETARMNCWNWETVNNDKAVQILKLAGWDLTVDDIRNASICSENGWIYFETVIDDTAWEVNPNTMESRHKGLEVGCFWTEWR